MIIIFCLLEKRILWIPEHPSVHVTLMWSMVIFCNKNFSLLQLSIIQNKHAELKVECSALPILNSHVTFHTMQSFLK